jgi:XTP/dITP diphosphohydrolase
MRVLLATTNRGKIHELGEILSGYGLEISGLETVAETELETGSTFEENALLKARYHHRQKGLITLADDSGLEVEALGGLPGVHSARYAEPGATDQERTRKLLEALGDVPKAGRQARFVSAAAVVWSGGERVFVGTVEGTILTEPRGSGGFGYDPIFYYEPLGRTFAELTRQEKWEVSHRGKAFRLLAAWLSRQDWPVDTTGSGDRITYPT